MRNVDDDIDIAAEAPIAPIEAASALRKHESTGSRTLKKLKKLLNKSEDEYITVAEFSKFTGLSVAYILQFLH